MSLFKTRKITYLIRHVVTLPHELSDKDEPTNAAVVDVTGVALEELTKRAVTAAGQDETIVSVTTRSERLDK